MGQTPHSRRLHKGRARQVTTRLVPHASTLRYDGLPTALWVDASHLDQALPATVAEWGARQSNCLRIRLQRSIANRWHFLLFLSPCRRPRLVAGPWQDNDLPRREAAAKPKKREREEKGRRRAAGVSQAAALGTGAVPAAAIASGPLIQSLSRRRLPCRTRVPRAPPGRPVPAPRPRCAATALPPPPAVAGSPWPVPLRGGKGGPPATAGRRGGKHQSPGSRARRGRYRGQGGGTAAAAGGGDARLTAAARPGGHPRAGGSMQARPPPDRAWQRPPWCAREKEEQGNRGAVEERTG